ncbi:MAG: hypothetical protein ACR2HH_01265 [Chthoniobacterales bacterium]
MIVKTAIPWLNTLPNAQSPRGAAIVIAALAGNANFVTPSPTLIALQAALDAFNSAIADAANDGKELITIQEPKAGRVSRTPAGSGQLPDGDRGRRLGEAAVQHVPIPEADARADRCSGPAGSPDLLLGTNSGELDGSTTPIYGAYTYNWRVALVSASATFVQTAQTTAASVAFKALTRGQAYLVQANAVGAADPTDWSDASTLMVI